MATDRAKPTQYLTYKATLISYDGVQLFVGAGRKNRLFICLAIPTDDGHEWFVCSPVRDKDLEEYLYQRIDLFALMRATTNGKHYFLCFSQENEKGYPLHEMPHSIPDKWMPDRHVFADVHTHAFQLESMTNDSVLDVQEHPIFIDGRWDAEDLSDLPNRYTDNYSFIYSLIRNEEQQNHITTDMFRKFPWRGGFSTVGFYKGLYEQIPHGHRLAVTGISYHSPGDITLSGVDPVMKAIECSVAAYRDEPVKSSEAYKQLYDGMSLRGLLGRSLEEIDPDPLDYEFVKTYAEKLSEVIKFEQLPSLFVLSGQDWIAAGKILMSYFRRLKALANFFDTGKASFEPFAKLAMVEYEEQDPEG